MVRKFGQPTFYRFMDSAVIRRRLTLPGYFSNPVRYLKAEWQPPGMRYVDPLRESKAAISEIGANIRSPQETCLERGRNYEDVLNEIKLAKDMAEARGLDYYQEVSTNVANNPAAVSNEGGNGNGSGRKLSVETEGLGDILEEKLHEILGI
jgi:capsid protein